MYKGYVLSWRKKERKKRKKTIAIELYLYDVVPSGSVSTRKQGNMGRYRTARSNQ
jgi:hypothetical protein